MSITPTSVAVSDTAAEAAAEAASTRPYLCFECGNKTYPYMMCDSCMQAYTDLWNEDWEDPQVFEDYLRRVDEWECANRMVCV